MEETTTLTIRISPSVKQQAEQILSSLGLSMSTAVEIFLRQVIFTNGIPFPVELPPAWKHSDIYSEIALSEKQIKQGKTKKAQKALVETKAKYSADVPNRFTK